MVVQSAPSYGVYYKIGMPALFRAELEAKCCEGRFLARRIAVFGWVRRVRCPWCGATARLMETWNADPLRPSVAQRALREAESLRLQVRLLEDRMNDLEAWVTPGYGDVATWEGDEWYLCSREALLNAWMPPYLDDSELAILEEMRGDAAWDAASMRNERGFA